MLAHFMKLFMRTIRRKRIYTAVNLLGISLGMLAAGLTYMFVRYEFSYDKFHERAANIYRVDSHFNMPQLANPEFHMAALSGPLSEEIQTQVPGMVRST